MTGLIALAFVTGMLSPANPCGFALLPAYLACHAGAERSDVLGRLVGGLRAGIGVTVGFVAVFALAGVAVAAGLRALLTIAPWLGLAVGVLMTAAGLWMLAGRALPSIRLGWLSRLGGPDTSGGGIWRFAVFGAAYATASLSCALPILLAFTAQAVASGDAADLIGFVAAFAAGVAVILVPLSITAMVAGGSLGARAQRLVPVLPRIAGAVLILTGVYLVFYWTPAVTGTTAGTSGLSQVVTDAASVASAWIASHQAAAVTFAVSLVVAALMAAAWAEVRRRKSQKSHPEGIL